MARALWFNVLPCMVFFFSLFNAILLVYIIYNLVFKHSHKCKAPLLSFSSRYRDKTRSGKFQNETFSSHMNLRYNLAYTLF